MASQEYLNLMNSDAVCSNCHPLENDNITGGWLGQSSASSMLNMDEGESNNSGLSEEQLPVGLVLKKALIIFRHGARTPLFTIPNIPQANYEAESLMVDMAETSFGYDIINAQSNGPRPFSQAEACYSSVVLKGGCLSGQLTLLGQQQTYNLGQVLKKDYVVRHKLIDQEYNKDQIFLKSTNINRTVKSLCCVIAGLFGVESLQKKAPVQIPVSDESNEVLIPNPTYCPNLQIYHLQAQKNADLASGTLHDRLIIEKCIGIDSINTKHRLRWIETRDDLVARMAHNLEIPKELVPYMEMIDKNATMQLYHAVCGQTDKDNPIACMLSCGKAINMFLEHLKMDSDEGSYRLYLYSCHDSTLTALLGAFGIFDFKWPPFAADLRIELYEDRESKKFVKVSYLSKNVIARGCTEIYTPYAKFMKGISSLAVDTDSHAAACFCKEIEKLAHGNNAINEDTDDPEERTKADG